MIINLSAFKDNFNGKIIDIDGISMQGRYVTTDKISRIYGGFNPKKPDQKIYIMEFLNHSPRQIFNLGNFKPLEKDAILFINSNIPNHCIVNLPDHIPTYITGQLGQDVQINSKNTVKILGNSEDKSTQGVKRKLESLPTASQPLPKITPTEKKLKSEESTESEFTKPVIHKQKELSHDQVVFYKGEFKQKGNTQSCLVLTAFKDKSLTTGRLPTPSILINPKEYQKYIIECDIPANSDFKLDGVIPTIILGNIGDNVKLSTLQPVYVHGEIGEKCQLIDIGTFNRNNKIHIIKEGKLLKLLKHYPEPVPVAAPVVLSLTSSLSSSSSALRPLPKPVDDDKRMNRSQMQQQVEGIENLRKYLDELQAEGESAEGKEEKKIDRVVKNDKAYKLRPHQLQAIKEYFASREKGNKHAVFDSATGSGKTNTFVEIAKATQERIMVFVPTRVLVQQTYDRFKSVAPLLKVAKLVPEEKSTLPLHTIIQKSNVIISTYSTLHNRYKDIPFNQVATVILDEAHNALSSAKFDIINHMKMNGCHILGFSATPTRNLKKYGDNKGVSSVYELLGFKNQTENSITPFRIRDAILAGANCPTVTKLVYPKTRGDIDFGAAAQTAGDISEKKAAKSIDKPYYNKMVVDIYANGGDDTPLKDGTASFIPFRGKQSVVFCAGIQHAIHVAEAFNANLKIEEIDPTGKLRNAYAERVAKDMFEEAKERFENIFKNKKENNKFVPSEQFKLDVKAAKERAFIEFEIARAVYSNSRSGDMKREDLDADDVKRIIKKYQQGGTLLLTGSDILKEGFDHPATSLIMNVRLTKSIPNKIQGSGRGLRVDPEDPDKIGTILDFVWEENANCTYFYEAISDPVTGEPCFEFGDVEKCRQGYHARNNVSIKMKTIEIADAVTYHMRGQCDPESTISIKRKKRLANIQKNPENKLEKSISKKKITNVKIADCISIIETTMKSLQASAQTLKKYIKIDATNNHSIPVAITTSDVGLSSQLISSSFSAQPEETLYQSLNRLIDDRSEAIETKVTLSEEVEEGINETLKNASSGLKSLNDLFKLKKEQQQEKMESKKDTSSKKIKRLESITSVHEKLTALVNRYQGLQTRINDMLRSAVIKTGGTSGDTSKVSSVNSSEFQAMMNDLDNITKQFSEINTEVNTLLPGENKKNNAPFVGKFVDLEPVVPERKYKKVSEEEKNKKIEINKLIQIELLKTGSLLAVVARVLKREQFIEIAEEIIKQNKDCLNEKDKKSGETAIHAAIESHYKIKWLVKQGLSINARDNQQDTCLHKAAKLANANFSFLDCFYKLATSFPELNINAVNEEGNTALHMLLDPFPHVDSLLLILFGARIDIPNKKGKTPLDLVSDCHRKALEKAWKESKNSSLINPNIRFICSNGKSLLHVAAERGSHFLFKSLIGKGLDYNQRDSLNNTPLHYAILNSKPSDYRFFYYILKLKDIDLTSQNNLGDTPLHIFMSRPFNRLPCIHLFLNRLTTMGPQEVKEALVIKNEKGETPFHVFMTSLSNMNSKIKISVHKKSIVNLFQRLYELNSEALLIPNQYKNTPLHYFYEAYKGSFVYDRGNRQRISYPSLMNDLAVEVDKAVEHFKAANVDLNRIVNEGSVSIQSLINEVTRLKMGRDPFNSDTQVDDVDELYVDSDGLYSWKNAEDEAVDELIAEKKDETVPSQLPVYSSSTGSISSLMSSSSSSSSASSLSPLLTSSSTLSTTSLANTSASTMLMPPPPPKINQHLSDSSGSLPSKKTYFCQRCQAYHAPREAYTRGRPLHPPLTPAVSSTTYTSIQSSAPMPQVTSYPGTLWSTSSVPHMPFVSNQPTLSSLSSMQPTDNHGGGGQEISSATLLTEEELDKLVWGDSLGM